MNEMKKNIAVIVRGGREEALRMALGLTLMSDRVDVFLTEAPPLKSETNDMNIEMLGDMRSGLFAVDMELSGFQTIGEDELPEKLLLYDVVIPF